jgi:FkbM family methyltransferase
MDETTRTPPPRFDDALEDETAPDASGRTPAEAARSARHGAHRPGLIGQAGMALGRALPPTRAGLRLAGAARPLALLGAGKGLADVKALGLKLRVDPRGSLAERRLFLTPQCHDRRELAAVARLMAPGKVFMEAEAGIAAYALRAARSGGPHARIIAVEPSPDMRRRILFNARTNGLEQIETAGAALSDYEGGPLLRLVDGHAAAKVTGLAALCDQLRLTRLDGLRLSVNGSEARVLGAFLADAPKSLWPGLLILPRPEGRDAKDEALATAIARGYRIDFQTPSNTVLMLNR